MSHHPDHLYGFQPATGWSKSTALRKINAEAFSPGGRGTKSKSPTPFSFLPLDLLSLHQRDALLARVAIVRPERSAPCLEAILS
jgi:hypothetical protein